MCVCVWGLFCVVFDLGACQRRFSLSMHMDVKVSHRVVFGRGTRSCVPNISPACQIKV